MRKLAALCIIGLCLGIGGVFAEHPNGLGLGIVGQYGYNGGFGPSLSLKVPSVPVYWGINLKIGSQYFGIGASGDYYFIDQLLVPDLGLGWYFGLGGYAGLGFWDNTTEFGLGARLPIGLSLQFLDRFEVFLDLAPSLGLNILPDVKFPAWDIAGDLGLRIWM